jgi:aminopeptidase N
MPYLHAMKKKLAIGMLCLLWQAATAQPIDVQHYRFELALSDVHDTIVGHATVTVQLRSATAELVLDLASVNASGKGMQVLSVSEGNNALPYIHQNGKLRLRLGGLAKAGETKTVSIGYRGIPADGLIIGKNPYGKRTFFGDNWPNRAHNWLPCNDVPLDKASLEFVVTAPDKYRVVGNGLLQSETLQGDGTKRTHWKETVPLPTKVMVIGVADFAVEEAGKVDGIPVSSWVYAEEKDKGFYDYAQAKEVLPFFIDYIGPYGYQKLANVQSKTIFGGMENASAIFYFEQSVTGKRTIEDLIAHEIAHQWFGNMVTETNFSHLWLSEGFATYLADLYIESKYGTDSLRRRLAEERQQVVAFAAGSQMPVLDSSANYMSLLNANSYQKGAWVLHMLRQQIGDKLFRKTIQAHYQKFAGKNAATNDFVATAEAVSGQKLKTFFKQWLAQPGIPVLKVNMVHDAAKKRVTVTVEQVQPALFSFPLELAWKDFKRGNVYKTVQVAKRRQTFSFAEPTTRATDLRLDPNTKLLWTAAGE